MRSWMGPAAAGSRLSVASSSRRAPGEAAPHSPGMASIRGPTRSSARSMAGAIRRSEAPHSGHGLRQVGEEVSGGRVAQLGRRGLHHRPGVERGEDVDDVPRPVLGEVVGEVAGGAPVQLLDRLRPADVDVIHVSQQSLRGVVYAVQALRHLEQQHLILRDLRLDGGVLCRCRVFSRLGPAREPALQEGEERIELAPHRRHGCVVAGGDAALEIAQRREDGQAIVRQRRVGCRGQRLSGATPADSRRKRRVSSVSRRSSRPCRERRSSERRIPSRSSWRSLRSGICASSASAAGLSPDARSPECLSPIATTPRSSHHDTGEYEQEAYPRWAP